MITSHKYNIVIIWIAQKYFTVSSIIFHVDSILISEIDWAKWATSVHFARKKENQVKLCLLCTYSYNAPTCLCSINIFTTIEWLNNNIILFVFHIIIWYYTRNVIEFSFVVLLILLFTNKLCCTDNVYNVSTINLHCYK